MYMLRTIWKRLTDIVKEAWIILVFALAMLMVGLWMDSHPVTTTFSAICTLLGLLGLFLLLLIAPALWERFRPAPATQSD